MRLRILALALLAASPATAAEPYRLAVGDSLSVMVFGRADLTGNFRIGQDQAIRLPLVGEVRAGGRTRGEVEADLSTKLSGLLDYQAQVVVDVAAFRPVFVIGDVATPGEYVFAPGLSALEAFAKAGGTPTLRQLPYDQAIGMASAERDLRLAKAELRNQLVRRAALEAALEGGDIVLPAELSAIAQSDGVRAAMAREVALLASERKQMGNQVRSLNAQRDQFKEEIAALEKQIRALGTQADLVRVEVDKISGLAEKGLATSGRLLDLRRVLADAEGDRFQASAFLSRAKQQMVELERRAQALDDDRRRRLLDERRLVDLEIERSRARAEGALAQLGALSSVNPADLAFARAEVGFTITRHGEVLVAKGDTPLMPGDVLEVRVDGDSPRPRDLSLLTSD
ncbi:MAG: polysaccharide biosynthesis/export family protein [Alphaproteobacteria bacterium]|nr:polysaccharide biosynthesis/export family protein [Alphaproteobacteria bacterium]